MKATKKFTTYFIVNYKHMLRFKHNLEPNLIEISVLNIKKILLCFAYQNLSYWNPYIFFIY